MKQWIKTASLIVLLSATALAQSQVGTVQGANYNPVNTMWWIFTLTYGLFGAVIGIAILWHCGQGALGNHEGWGRVVNVIEFAAVGFGVVFIISRMTLGAQAPI